MLDTFYMAARAVQVSIDEELLGRIDKDPEAKRKGRSFFLRSAVLAYLELKRRRNVDDAFREAYAGKSRELALEIDDLIDAQAWPKT
jgi:metal-responsive CopG/Arc/MetJ family transcriptional regulator